MLGVGQQPYTFYWLSFVLRESVFDHIVWSTDIFERFVVDAFVVSCFSHVA